MNIWLDDIRLAPDGFQHVRTVDEFKRAVLSCEKLDTVSLDHDLGDDEGTGYDCLKWLAYDHPEKWPRVILCHSANPVGRENILCFAAFARRHGLA